MEIISFVIPSLYEYKNLEYLFSKLTTLFEHNTNYIFEVNLVDGKNPDQKTMALCDKYGINYINREPNNFFGDAIRTGLKKCNANSKWLVIMDADGSHDPDFVNNFIQKAEQNPEIGILIASRYIKGGSTENNFLLIFLSRVVNLVYKIIFSLKVNDVSNNFRMYKYEIIEGLELKENNFEIVEEILIKLNYRNKNLIIEELPFNFQKRNEGKSKRKLLPFAITFLVSIFRLKKYEK